jgi:hypothetical protein
MKKLIGFAAALSLFAAENTLVNFDTAPLGKMPPGWSARMTSQGAPPRWEIRRDESAPSQPYVLAQISNEPPGSRSPLAILESASVRDGDFSVRIKPVGGQSLQGGLVWRYRDENNYYLVTVSAIDKTVAVYRVQNGERTPILPQVKRDIPSNGWSILKISARGNRFQVYVDHRRILQGSDGTFPQSGKIGLWSDSVTYFDDFRVYPK